MSTSITATINHSPWSKALRLLEVGLLGLGLLLSGIYAKRHIFSRIESQQALKSFESGQSSELLPSGNEANKGGIDFSLWSPGRLKAYQNSLAERMPPPIAILKIPKIHLEVAVFDGTEDSALDRGVGRIVGTAKPGEQGNIGIAGHRDGFFRGLKDIGPEDTIELTTHEKKQVFFVDRIQTVYPSDVSVLRAQDAPLLTLVTCYPFYHVGSAPQRFIVRARLGSETPRGQEK
jgi:sortase A